MKSIPLAAEFIYLATSAECTELINRPIAVDVLSAATMSDKGLTLKNRLHSAIILLQLG